MALYVKHENLTWPNRSWEASSGQDPPTESSRRSYTGDRRAFHTQQVSGRRLRFIICLPWSLDLQKRVIQGVGVEGGWGMGEEGQKSMNMVEKTIAQKDACTPMFIAMLFTVARTWKQPECPSTDEWIKKMWYIYTMEYYSVINKNEIMPFAATWMDLEIIILSEVSQTEKDILYDITHMWNLI